MKIKMKNYARHLWLSLLLLVGVAAIAVPGLNETNESSVAKIDGTEYATLKAAVDAAGDGAIIQVIKAGEYAIPAITKNLTIEGAVDGVVVKHEANSAITTIASGKTATFKNITFNLGKLKLPTAHGFGTQSGSNGALVMDGCTIDGALNLFGESTFTNCKFNAEGIYNIWAVNDTATFTGCTFDNTNRAVNVYDQKKSSTNKNVSFSGCTFNGSEKKKAAVNIHHNPDPVGAAAKYAVSITNCTTSDGTWASTVEETGEPDGSTICYSPLWMISDIVNWEDGDITVTVDGKLQDVSKFSPVAKIGDTKYTSLQAAVDAAEVGATIDILKDFTLTTVTTSPSDKYNVNVNKSVTINGNGHVLTGAEGKRAIVLQGAGNNVVLKDITVKSNKAEACLWIADAVNVTLDNSTLDGTNGKSYNQPLTIGQFDSESRVALNIINGSIIKTNDAGTAHYDIIAWHPADITVTNSKLIGWAGVYLKPDAAGSTVKIDGSEMKSTGIKGNSNNFAAIVTESGNNEIEVKDTKISTTPAENTNQSLFMLGGEGNVVKFLGSSTYETTDMTYGPVTHEPGSLVNNKVYFDDATKAAFAKYFTAADGPIISDEKESPVELYPLVYTPEVYYYWIVDGKEDGGYYHFAEPFTNGWLDNGEFIRLNKDVTLTSNLAWAKENASFTLILGDYKVTKGNFSVSLKPGVTVHTDKSTSIFSAAEEGYVVKSTKSDNGYTYTVEEADLMFTDANGKVSYKAFSPSVISANGTYKLLKDVTATARIAPTILPTNIIVDLNGHTLTSTATDCAILLSRAGTEAKPKTFELVDNSEEKGGKLVVNAEANAAIQVQGKYNEVTIGEGVTVENGCVAILSENDKLTVAGTIIGGDDFAVATNGSSTKNANIPIKEGAVLTTNKPAMYLPANEGLVATVEGGSITGAKTGIEVRAGQLTVNGGTISTTAKEYSYTPNGNGTTTKGAAIAVVQHTTVLPTDVQVLGGTLEGTKTIAVVDAQSNNLEGVTVKAKDELVAANTEIPAGFKWVSADGVSTLTKKEYVAQVGDVQYETLQEAIVAATAGQTITLLADIDANEQIEVGKQVTLDLNGKTIEYKSEATLTSGVIMVLRGGDLTVTDTSEGATAAIKSGTKAYAAIALTKKGETSTETARLTVNNGTIEGYYYAIVGNTRHGTEITINGGVIKGTADGNQGIYHPQEGTLTINGGTISGYSSAVELRSGTLNITGGTLSASCTDFNYQPNQSGTTTDGAVIAIAQHSTLKAINVSIAGATLNGAKTIAVTDAQNNNLKDITVSVADGLTEKAYIPEGFKWVSDGTMSTLTPRDHVAKIGETVYYSLASAIAAVPNDGTETTITLLADVTENPVVKDGKNIVLDLGKKTLTGYIDQYDGELNVKNGTLAGTVYVNGGPASAETGYNKFTLAADATITSDWGFILYQGPNGNDAYGSVIDINGTVNGTAWVMGNITEGNSVINVNSGAKIEGSVFGLNGLATLNVKEGATIIGSETGIEVRAGNLNVEGGTITSTATKYIVNPNGSGTTTTGAAIAIAQHTTGLPINANITGGTLSGPKTISVADPQGLNYTGVVVTAKDELTEGDVVIPDGYIWVSNNNGTSTLKTKEDAGIYELRDWEVYPYLSYTEDKEAASVTYIRRFGNTNWQALYIPFDINDISELTDKYEFAKIHMVALENDGQWTTGDKIEVYYTKMTEGKIHANKPYLIRAKNSGEQSIVVENTILHDTHNVNPMQTETTAAVYAFTGTYEGVDATSSNTFFAMGGGTINFCDNAHLGAYRWYLNFEPKTDDYAKPIIDFIESDSDATGVSSVKTGDDSDIEGYYNINGVRSETPVRGINIIRYKNGSTRKVVIK